MLCVGVVIRIILRSLTDHKNQIAHVLCSVRICLRLNICSKGATVEKKRDNYILFSPEDSEREKRPDPRSFL